MLNFFNSNLFIKLPQDENVKELAQTLNKMTFEECYQELLREKNISKHFSSFKTEFLYTIRKYCHTIFTITGFAFIVGIVVSIFATILAFNIANAIARTPTLLHLHHHLLLHQTITNIPHY